MKIIALLLSLSFLSPSAQAYESGCKLSPQAMQKEISDLRHSLGCEYYKWDPKACSDILELSGAAAAAATAVGVARKIRNPIDKCAFTPFEKPKDIWQILMVSVPAYAASQCSVEMKFLQRDVDRLVSKHVEGIDAATKTQNALLNQTRDDLAKNRAAAKKALGYPADSQPSDQELLAKLKQKQLSAPPPKSVLITPAEQPRVTARTTYFRKLDELDALARQRLEKKTPELEAAIVKKKAEMVAANNNYMSMFKTRGEEEIWKYKLFEHNAVNGIVDTEAELKRTANAAARAKLEEKLESLHERLGSYRAEASRLGANNEGLYKQVFKEAASEGPTLDDIALNINKGAEVESTARGNIARLHTARFAWRDTQAAWGREGATGLEDMRKALSRVRSEGTDISSVEHRFFVADARATAEGILARGGTISRSILVRGVPRLAGAAIGIAGSGGVALAAELVRADPTGCDTMKPYYTSFNKDCSLNYSINSSNADILFSDQISNGLAKDDPNFACFVKKNWEERVANWKVTCHPKPGSGKFSTKIYAERPDGTQFYFAQTGDPKLIEASLSDRTHMATAIEAASCCLDTNPRISDSECARYGIKMDSSSQTPAGKPTTVKSTQ